MRGFTLLEIMVAVAILAATLVVLLQIVTNNVRATNHAKLTTAATFLARTKMSDIEDYILYKGFTSESETGKGTFKDEGYPQFRWDSTIERIELPTDMTQKTQDAATRQDQGRQGPDGDDDRVPGRHDERVHRADPDRAAGVGPQGDGARRLGRDRAPEPVASRWSQYLTDPSQLEKAMLLGGGAAAAGAAPGAKPPGAPGRPQGSAASQTPVRTGRSGDDQARVAPASR